MRRHFERAHKNAGLDFVSASSSIRSAPATACSARSTRCSRQSDIAASVTADTGGFPPHIALPDAPPGLVEIWEPESRTNAARSKAGTRRSTGDETSPRVKLARRIARTVRGLVDGRGSRSASERRAARYGDMLILVRQRGALFEAIIRALKNENVQVAGADRLVLTEHIAVMDLMALADALLLPEDDLALATVLRSPLFGFDRRRAVRDRMGPRPLLAARGAARKAAERRKIRDRPPRASTSCAGRAARRRRLRSMRILGAGGARRRFLARLGAEANDALDEFLNLALDYRAARRRRRCKALSPGCARRAPR